MKKQLLEKLLEKYLLEWDTPTIKETQSPFVGKYVIVRCYDAGVWCGKLIDWTKGNIVLEDARNLWRRWAKSWIGLSWVASYGIDESKDSVRVLETQKRVLITDERVSTFLECGEEVEKQLREYPVANQS